MRQKIRWGVLSTANIGRKVLPAIQQSNNGEVYAVASRDLERARAFADEMNIPHAYGSYEDLLADPDIDAIYIPLPNHMHAEWSIRCAEAGKPTLCEKPLASNAPEAQRMVDVFAERDVLLGEAFMYRFHPQTQQVKTIIDQGGVGTIRLMQAAFSFRVKDEANIRLQGDMAGGALMDVGCYCVNVMRFMTGEEPDAFHAMARFKDVDESLVGTLAFPSGALGHLDCSLRTYRQHGYEIRGTEGRIVVEPGFGMDPDEDTIIRHWIGDDYEEIHVPAANHYTLMAEDFADAIMRGRQPRFPVEDAVKNMQVIDGLLGSARA